MNRKEIIEFVKVERQALAQLPEGKEREVREARLEEEIELVLTDAEFDVYNEFGELPGDFS
jgi:hypothetical protein